MSSRKPPMPIEEHVRLGRELKAMRDTAHQVLMAADRSSCPAATVRNADRLCVLLEKLRDRLDSQLAHDHPGAFDPKVYYGDALVYISHGGGG